MNYTHSKFQDPNEANTSLDDSPHKRQKSVNDKISRDSDENELIQNGTMSTFVKPDGNTQGSIIINFDKNDNHHLKIKDQAISDSTSLHFNNNY